jgi:hypothetical protein
VIGKKELGELTAYLVNNHPDATVLSLSTLPDGEYSVYLYDESLNFPKDDILMLPFTQIHIEDGRVPNLEIPARSLLTLVTRQRETSLAPEIKK